MLSNSCVLSMFLLVITGSFHSVDFKCKTSGDKSSKCVMQCGRYGELT